jgi:hypothetical protein
VDNTDLIEMDKIIENEINVAFHFAQTSKFPDRETFGEFTYCD